MNIQEEVVKEVVRTKDFEIVPARSEPRTLSFVGPDKVNDSLNRIDRWDVVYDDKKKMPTLRLWKGSNGVAFLYLDSTGIFRGRERDSNGNCLLRPLPLDANRWKMLGNPSKFMARIKPDESEEGFIYKEPLPAPFNWEPYEFDLSKENFSAPTSDTAIALVTWNRPQYFSQVVHGLALNKEIGKLPVFCFMDKPTLDVEKATVEAQRRILLDQIPHAIPIIRPINFGCGRNIIDARRQLFDKLHFKRAFIFEDDMIPSYNYLEFVTNMMNWAEENYSDVGTVQGWNICGFSQEEKYRRRRDVTASFTNRWGYLQRKDAWDCVKAEMYTYEKLFLFAQYYHQRPHRSIQHWFQIKTGKTPVNRGDKKFPISSNSKAHWSSLLKSMPTGQDGVSMVLDHVHGWKRLASVVNRGKYIGKIGIHMSPQRFIQHGLDKIEFHQFANDGLIVKFKEVT
jgi:hypothetical protein